MNDDVAASAIASVASVATQPIIPPLVPFVFNPAHAIQCRFLLPVGRLPSPISRWDRGGFLPKPL